MMQTNEPKDALPVYLEIGKKKTFAGAVEWPGWMRSGRDEEAALQELLAYGPRYARLLRSTRLDFHPPEDILSLKVVERLEGDTTTDFGAPGKAVSSDGEQLGSEELDRLELILKAGWKAFDEAADAAAGRELRKGPRGGGRELEGIVRHVAEADLAYLSALGWKVKGVTTDAAGLGRIRQEILDGLESSARGELPRQGPRGGERWSARYFVRRSSWHTLDHAWEIEDRIV
jgi:hypothetical protein